MARRLERIDARRLYCEELVAIAEIAKRMQIAENTIYRWKSEDAARGADWDSERETLRMTSFSAYKQAIKIAVDKLTSMATSGEIDFKDADGLTKIIKAAKSLYKDVDSLGNIILAMNEFADFLAERSPETLDSLQPWIAEFGQVMSKKYSKRSG
jgi:transposase-like protein